MRLFPLLIALVHCSERIVITNMEPRETRGHEPVFTSGSSFVNTRVPGKCGWGDSPLCFMLVTLEHGGNCSLSTPSYGSCGYAEGRILTHVTSDLSSGYWGHAVELLPGAVRPKGAYSRPHLAYNPTTRAYALWVSYRPPASSAAHFLTATCASEACPDAPFTVASTQAATAQPTAGTGGALFVEEDGGAAYLAHCLSASAGGGLQVQRLRSPDWAAAEAGQGAASSPLHLPGQPGCEAPAMFKRRGVYYVLFGAACSYCAGGTETHAFAAQQPLGPYSYAGSLGNVAAAQMDGVLAHGDVDGVLWMGSVWGKGYGGLDRTPAHWASLEFYAEEAAAGLPWVRPMVFYESFALSVHTP